MLKLIILIVITQNVAAVNFTLFYRSVYFEPAFVNGITNTLDFILEHSLSKIDHTVTDFCASRLHHSYPKSRALILLNSCDLDQLYKHYIRPKSYVIFFTKTSELLEILKIYVKSPSWNPKAKFIFLTINLDVLKSSPILSKFFQQNFVNNFIICSVSTEKSIMSVYSWNVSDLSQVYYKKSVIFDLIQDFKFNTKLKLNKELFPKKQYFDFNFMKYKIAPVFIPPYLINASADEYPGAEGTLLRFLSQRINFTYEFLPHSFITWGVKINGVYTDTFSLLEKKKVDIIMGMVRPNTTECQDFDCYYDNYLSDTVNWYVPKAGLIPENETLKLLFTPIVWTFMFLTLALFSIIWCIFNHLMESDYIHGLLNLWALILSNPITKSNSHPVISFFSFQSVILIILFFNLMISTSFQSYLINALTNPSYTKQIDSIDDLLDSGLKYGVHENVWRILRNDTANRFSQVLTKNAEDCKADNSCLNRTAFKRDYATCKPKKQGSYLVPKFYLDKNGESLLYEIEKPIYWFPVAIIFRKGLPIFEHANGILLKYAEMGLIAKLLNEINEKNRSLTSKKSKSSSGEAFSLTFGHLSGIFNLLILGHILAIISFLLEFIYFKLKRKKQ